MIQCINKYSKSINKVAQQSKHKMILMNKTKYTNFNLNFNQLSCGSISQLLLQWNPVVAPLCLGGFSWTFWENNHRKLFFIFPFLFCSLHLLLMELPHHVNFGKIRSNRCHELKINTNICVCVCVYSCGSDQREY